VPEQMPWRELPASWSPLEPGEAFKMTALMPSDPEFMKVERDMDKSSGILKSCKKLVSVSETRELVSNRSYNNNNNSTKLQTNYFYSPYSKTTLVNVDLICSFVQKQTTQDVSMQRSY